MRPGRRARAVAGAAALLAGSTVIVWWNFSARVRTGRPDLERLERLAGDHGAALWLARPQQNLAALEEAMGDLEEVVPAAMGLFGASVEHLPRLGPFRAPPARELTIAFPPPRGDEMAAASAGTAAQAPEVVLRARFGPILRWVLRAAGHLASNPWLAGGEVSWKGRAVRVEWRGGEWRAAPLAWHGRAHRPPPRPTASPGRGDGSPPAVAWWVVGPTVEPGAPHSPATPIAARRARSAGWPAPGRYRLDRDAGGDWLLAAPGGRPAGSEERSLPPGVAAWMWQADPPAAGGEGGFEPPSTIAEPGALQVLFGAGAAEDADPESGADAGTEKDPQGPSPGRPAATVRSRLALPALAILRAPGSRERLPAEETLDLVGAMHRLDRPSGWSIVAYDAPTARRLDDLATALDLERRCEALARQRLVRWGAIRPRRAAGAVRALHGALAAFPLAPAREVRRLESLLTLLGSWPEPTEIEMENGLAPDSFRLSIRQREGASPGAASR